MSVYVQMAQAGLLRVAGVWNYEPTTEERRAAYSKYLGKEVNEAATLEGTLLEIHEMKR